MKLRAVALVALLTLVVAACGGSSEVTSSPASASTNDASATNSDDTVSTDDAVEDVVESSEELAEDLVESLEEVQSAVGGGSAMLTVGDESWTFEPVLCAFGPEEIGQEGAEFVLSSIQDGKQMYFSIDSFGHSVSLDDVTDFENPSVSLSSVRGEDFILIDGKNFSGSAEFRDDTTESFETVSGTFSGTCP